MGSKNAARSEAQRFRFVSWPLRVQLALLVFVAGILIGVPWSFASYQSEADYTELLRARGQEESIRSGATTQAEWDEFYRGQAESIAATRAYERAHGLSSGIVPTSLAIRLIWVGLATGGALLVILWPNVAGRIALAEYTRRK